MWMFAVLSISPQINLWSLDSWTTSTISSGGGWRSLLVLTTA